VATLTHAQFYPDSPVFTMGVASRWERQIMVRKRQFSCCTVALGRFNSRPTAKLMVELKFSRFSTGHADFISGRPAGPRSGSPSTVERRHVAPALWRRGPVGA
jgi:hypothetical protein